MKFLKPLPIIFLIILIAAGCEKSSSQNGDPFLKWAKNNSQEIKTIELNDDEKDITLLDKIVGNAKVVCLGESRHDIHEQYKLKHRFIKRLVEELGFTTFILEASLPYAEEINQYILTGNGNIEDIMANMPGWFLWDTAEMLDVVKWIRNYNANPSNGKKIKFYGIDIVAPNYGLEQIFAYLNKTDQSSAERFKNKNFAREIIDDNFWPTSLQRYSSLTDDEKKNLRNNYDDLYNHLKQNEDKYITTPSAEEYDWILRLAYCAAEANKMFSETDRLTMGIIRDNAMAQNVLWIKNQVNDEKVIVWSHNVHIAKDKFTMTALPGSVIKGMGNILSDELKDDMISIGASLNQGEFDGWNKSFPPAREETLDGAFAKLNYDYLLIDLKGASDNKAVTNWLYGNKTFRGQDFDMTCVPAKAFDAFFFVNRVTRAHPNPRSLERLGNMN